MSRDPARYAYTQVGIPRTDVLEHLQEEAQARGVPFATHLVDLLVDRDAALYQGASKGIWFPRERPLPANPVPVPAILPQDSGEAAIVANIAAFDLYDDEDTIETAAIRRP